jgi:hypothetical protein
MGPSVLTADAADASSGEEKQHPAFYEAYQTQDQPEFQSSQTLQGWVIPLNEVEQ